MPIPVTAAQSTLGIDFALEKGNLISGTVTGDKTDQLTSARVLIFDADGDPVSMAYPDEHGVYTSGASLPPGEYYVEAEDLSRGLASELYKATVFDGSCNPWQRCDVMTGNPVSISAGTDMQQIDFILAAKVAADTPAGGNSVSTGTSGSGTVSAPILMLLLLAGIRRSTRRTA